MNFEHFLYQYLLTNHRAEVPGFGIFRLTKESAKIDAANSIITPPTEVVDFQYQPSVSDNDLVKYIAEKTNSDLAAVQQRLEAKVQSWMQELSSKNSLILENLGQFQLDGENNVIRTTDGAVDLFGLEAINLQTLKNPSAKLKKVSGDYAMNKNVVWTFLLLIIIGAAAFFMLGDQQLIFGKSSQIPTKKIQKKEQPKAPALPKQDSLKTDSIKQTSNAKIQKISR